MQSLVVDGMVSGTGLRYEGGAGYINLSELGLSEDLISRIDRWLKEYETSFYFQYKDEIVIEKLDKEGLEITKGVRKELKNCKIAYFSDARMKRIDI